MKDFEKRMKENERILFNSIVIIFSLIYISVKLAEYIF
jgi:hypothetical protein